MLSSEITVFLATTGPGSDGVHHHDGAKQEQENARNTFQGIDIIFTLLFTFELAVNMFAHWFRPFFKDGWNWVGSRLMRCCSDIADSAQAVCLRLLLRRNIQQCRAEWCCLHTRSNRDVRSWHRVRCCSATACRCLSTRLPRDVRYSG
eukprot:739092-Rhodomonas_salina.6